MKTKLELIIEIVSWDFRYGTEQYRNRFELLLKRIVDLHANETKPDILAMWKAKFEV